MRLHAFSSHRARVRRSGQLTGPPGPGTMQDNQMCARRIESQRRLWREADRRERRFRYHRADNGRAVFIAHCRRGAARASRTSHCRGPTVTGGSCAAWFVRAPTANHCQWASYGTKHNPNPHPYIFQFQRQIPRWKNSASLPFLPANWKTARL